MKNRKNRKSSPNSLLAIQSNIKKRVKWWHIIVLYGLQIAVFQFMEHVTFPIIQKNLGSLKMFDMMKQGYNLTTVHEILDKMGTEGMDEYLHVQMPLDFLYPVLMAAVFGLILIKTSSKPRYTYIFVPLLLVLFDWMENLCIIRMLTSMDFTFNLVQFSSFCTRTKAAIGDYILYFAALIAIAVYILRWMIAKFTKKTKVS